MRYKPEHKQETRRRIVESAAKEFRTHGFEGSSIAKLMETLHLTHGGFYAHFADKEELVADATVFALSKNLEIMLAGLQEGGFTALLDYYLSESHRDNPASGCPLPSVVAELARRPPLSRDNFTTTLQKVFDAISEQMPGATQARKQEKVQVLFATLTGAVALSRAVSDPVLSKSLLTSARNHLLHFIYDG